MTERKRNPMKPESPRKDRSGEKKSMTLRQLLEKYPDLKVWEPEEGETIAIFIGRKQRKEEEQEP